ncbi:unnamed protein product [Urochloa humidicola]
MIFLKATQLFAQKKSTLSKSTIQIRPCSLPSLITQIQWPKFFGSSVRRPGNASPSRPPPPIDAQPAPSSQTRSWPRLLLFPRRLLSPSRRLLTFNSSSHDLQREESLSTAAIIASRCRGGRLDVASRCRGERGSRWRARRRGAVTGGDPGDINLQCVADFSNQHMLQTHGPPWKLNCMNVLWMRMSYSPAAHFFLFLVQWTDCSLAGALGLLRILIYKGLCRWEYHHVHTTHMRGKQASGMGVPPCPHIRGKQGSGSFMLLYFPPQRDQRC